MKQRYRHSGLWAVVAAAVLLATPANSDPSRQTARHSLAIASMAADAWVDDAHLVWVENDSDLDAQGRAQSWGYLFYSESLGAMRSWSVRQGKLEKPHDHSVRAVAPALEPNWIDSAAVMEKAWRQVKEESEADWSLVSLVLVRGVFDKRPTWVAVFDRGEGPRLHVVLAANDGDLLRRWRG